MPSEKKVSKAERRNRPKTLTERVERAERDGCDLELRVNGLEAKARGFERRLRVLAMPTWRVLGLGVTDEGRVILVTGQQWVPTPDGSRMNWLGWSLRVRRQGRGDLDYWLLGPRWLWRVR